MHGRRLTLPLLLLAVLAVAGCSSMGPEGPIPPLIRIVSSADRPDDSFVAAPYRG